jgi:hypothetical protein
VTVTLLSATVVLVAPAWAWGLYATAMWLRADRGGGPTSRQAKGQAGGPAPSSSGPGRWPRRAGRLGTPT